MNELGRNGVRHVLNVLNGAKSCNPSWVLLHLSEFFRCFRAEQVLEWHPYFPLTPFGRSIHSLLTLLVIFAQFGCDEVLPPRDEPQQFLVTTAIGVDGALIYHGGALDGNGGALLLTAKNVYSEVLQGDERIRGNVDVWMRDFPDKRAAVLATKSNLTNPNLVRANLVTLGPDTTATLLKRWEHQVTAGTDSGHFFWQYVDSTEKFTPLGERYWESDPVHFVAEARIQIFKNVQAVKVKEFEFTVVYRRF